MKIKRLNLVFALIIAGVAPLCCCVFAGVLQRYDIPQYYLKDEWSNSSVNLAKLRFEGSARSILFSHDSEQILAGIDSFSKWDAKIWHGEVRVWSVESKKEAHLERFECYVRSLHLHPDGKKLLIATSNDSEGRPGVPTPAQVIVVEYPTFRLLDRLEVGKTIAADGAKFSPDGKWLAVQKKDSFDHWDPWVLGIYETKGLKNLAEIRGLNQMAGYEFTPDSKYILGCYYLKVVPKTNGYHDPVVDAFDVNNGTRAKRLAGFYHAYFVHAGKRLLILSGDEAYEYQSLDNLHPTLIPDYLRNKGGLAYSADGRFAVAAKSEFRRNKPVQTEVVFADTQSERLIKAFRDNSNRETGPTCRAFSPDGKYFAVGRSAARDPFGPNEAPGPAMGDVLLFTVPE